MNRVTLLGNLGADAELKVLANGDAVANFSIATTEKWKDREGNPQEKTEWHRCSIWGKRASGLAPHLQKGTKVLVEGKLETRSYEKDGEKRYTTAIKVTELEFASGKKESTEAPPEPSVGDDEIPF
jgi:single-strand DNA-binding protein